MASYNELIKNFEKIRNYVRDFYVYGFKTRANYDGKSLRSYDDERRRVESWLDGHMGFVRTPEGKNVFISIDSRSVSRNPLYKAWKSKSFTDGDITFHFILMDVLYSPKISLTVAQILDEIDKNYLECFNGTKTPDESTVRKKLEEYVKLGVIEKQINGKSAYYRRTDDLGVDTCVEGVHFFSEVLPCGVVGSFILDKKDVEKDVFCFKHHYVTSSIDSDVTAMLFDAMRKKSYVKLKVVARNKRTLDKTILPLKILISVQNGRQHLLAKDMASGKIKALRIDSLTEVEMQSPCEDFDEIRSELDKNRRFMWGVNYNNSLKTERVDFTIKIKKGEEYVVNRLLREKRIGRVEKIDDEHYRFTADVFDTGELIPWIRSFICRITKLNFSNRTIENSFKKDLEDTYALYGIKEREKL